MVASNFWTIAVLYLSFLSISPSYASTDTVSCVLFKDYLSPAHSYSIFFTDDTSTCWKACAAEEKCVAWTRDTLSGKCALKSDCDILVAVAGAESGVKYISDGEPVLKYNGVGASLIYAKSKPKSPTPTLKPAAPTPTVVTASASAVSTGGSSVAVVSADESGIQSKTAVSGAGSASTSASTPTLSLAVTTVAKDGETAKLAVSYFKDVSYIGTVPIIGGKTVQIITNAVAEPPCLTCDDYTCISVPGTAYKGGKIIKDVETDDIESCCQLCRKTKYCVSWWRKESTKRCVLNSDYPDYTSNEKFYGGTCF